MISDSQAELADYDINIRIITFSIVSIFLILMSIYFIRTYASRKHNIINHMRSEANIIANTFYNDLAYSEYFLETMASSIQNHYHDISYIQKILFKHQGNFSNIETWFGWKKYSWVNDNFEETVNSVSGIINNPRVSFIKDIILANDWKKIIMHVNEESLKHHRLKLIASVADKITGQYAGSVVLNYDVATVINRLNFTKANHDINFIIIDDKYRVIAKSKLRIKNILNQDSVLSDNLISYLHNKNSDNYYLDVLSGQNFYIQKIYDTPFSLIVNLDNVTVRSDILYNVIEILIIVCIFLSVTIAIYKHETWLRTKAEEASRIANRLTKAKSEFLAFTAHEIRSPLGFILTGSEMINKEMFGPVANAYKDYVQGINKNAQVILDFMDDILDETQILEGKFSIIDSTVNIIDAINTSILVNKTRYNQRKIEIIFDHKLVPNIIGDKRRILQILNNILSNAIKYSKDNTVININVYIAHSNLIIDVIDHGIGMTDKEINAIFSSDKTAFKKHSNFVESHGLGLSIVRMLLDAHQAKFIISSRPNIGTKVQIIYPNHRLKL